MDPVIVGVIIFVSVLGVAFIAILFIRFGVYKVKRKFQNSIIGAIINGVNRELKASNQSIGDIDFRPDAEPRSISDLSSAVLPSIAKDFPDLNMRQMQSSVEQLLRMSLAEIERKSAKPSENQTFSLLGELENKSLPMKVTASYRESLQRRIADLRAKNQSESFANMKIHRTGIRSYEKVHGTRAITFEMAIEYFHIIKQNGVVISGNANRLEQARYRIRVIHIMNESGWSTSEVNTVAMVCPSCGAPQRSFENKHCLYCGAGITPINMRVWRADRITES